MMKKKLAVLSFLTLAIAAAVAPIHVNVAPVAGEGLVDVSRCSAFRDNCKWDDTKECASTDGGWVENYCNLTPGPAGQGMPCKESET